MIGILNTPSGNRYLFSGSAINTPATVPVDEMLNGTTTQAGLKTVMAERATGRRRGSRRHRPVADHQSRGDAAGDIDGGLGGGRCRRFAVRTEAEPGVVIADRRHRDRSLPVHRRRSRSPSAPPIPMRATRSASHFNQPDGTTASVQLTATTTSPPPTGSFLIGATPAATAANLNTALNTRGRHGGQYHAGRGIRDRSRQ